MSHLVSAPLKILDLEALRTAAATFGATMEKKSTYVWYGQVVDPDKLPKGMKVEDAGKCEYAIKVPGINYELGVVRQKDGSFTLAFDFWGAGTRFYEDTRTPGAFHDGVKLKEKFGDNLCRLSQAYAVQVVTRQAKARGVMYTQKVLSNGSIQLRLINA